MGKLALALFVIMLVAAVIAPPAAAANVPCQDASPVLRAVTDASAAPVAPTVREEEAEDRPLEPAVSPGKHPMPSPLATGRMPWMNATAPTATGPPDLPPPRSLSTV